MDDNGNKISKEQIIAAGLPLLGTIGLEALTHNPEVLGFGVIASLACGAIAPTVREIAMEAFAPSADRAVHAAQQVLEALPVEDNSDLPQDFLSKMKRIAGIKEPEPAAQPKEEQRDNTATRRAVKPLPGKAGKVSAAQAMIPAQFMLDEVVEEIRRVNKAGYVYFGRDAASEAVVIRLADMYHVFDVSSSGKGKSNRFRLAMMQMVNTCETYCINPLANNIKAVKDERKIEVWKPIYERLANGRPMKTREEILAIMQALKNEIASREQREANEDFDWLDEPVFVFVDELPEIFKRCPEAIDLLDDVARTGRQYCVFAWVASQSAAVEDIGQNTATQAQYKTRIYGGGDRNSSNRLMKGPVSAEQEQLLQTEGAGLTLMLAEGFDKSRFVRAPLVTNEALFQYFKLPPFNIDEWLPAKKALPAMRQRNALDLSLAVSREVSQSTFTANTTTPQAQNTVVSAVKVEDRESVKAPEPSNIDAILDALNALADEEKALTVNAVMRRAGLTWRQTEEIEDVAERYGFELVRGKGRPASK